VIVVLLLPSAYCLLLTAYCLLPSAFSLLPALLFTVYCLLFTVYSFRMLTLELAEPPTDEDSRSLIDGVRSFNRDRTGVERPRTVAYFLRDEERRIIGGVQGMLWGRSTHVDVLWVDEDYRGQGHGAKLMSAIENYGAEHGHPLMYLETASFQALPFYEGLGYQIFGELSEISEGHTLFFLKKVLNT
jgi:GNAT superfamily N-acetyltransferase